MNPPRLICLTALLALLFAGAAYADGTYQRTDDRKKTLVWNNDPKPDDAASWSGDRDEDGYATGPGTLKWFRRERTFLTGSNILSPRKTLISSYSGTMEHGKFTGNVTTVDHGRTYHAKFADGHKTGRWMAGPLVNKAESTEAATLVKKAEKAAPETSTEIASEAPAEETSEEKAESRKAEEAAANAPAEGPAEEKPEVTGQKSEISKPVATEQKKLETKQKISQPLIAQASSEEPDQSPTPRASATRKAALQPGAVRAIERPTHTIAKKSEAEPVMRAERAKPDNTDQPPKIAKPASSQPPKADLPPSEDIPAEGPVAAKPENVQQPEPAKPSTPNAQPAARESPVDNSIQTLTGPPASLHINPPPPETNPPTRISTPPMAAASSPASQGPKLTAVNAMDIADIEARTKGYDLGEYQLPKADYNAASDTWSVGYVARDADNTNKKLSVIIQDKTGKAEVKN